MKDFLISNYVLILSIILVSVITLIGYFVDKSKNSQKEKVIKKVDNPVLINNSLINQNNNIMSKVSEGFDINRSINNLTNNMNNQKG